MSFKVFSSNGKVSAIDFVIEDKEEIISFEHLIMQCTVEDACPACKSKYMNNCKYKVHVDKPLNNIERIGIATIECNMCGEETMVSAIEYTPFKSICTIINTLEHKITEAKKQRSCDINDQTGKR